MAVAVIAWRSPSRRAAGSQGGLTWSNFDLEQFAQDSADIYEDFRRSFLDESKPAQVAMHRSDLIDENAALCLEPRWKPAFRRPRRNVLRDWADNGAPGVFVILERCKDQRRSSSGLFAAQDRVEIDPDDVTRA